MELLTIGAFARASRLTPKALRLYDDAGLLPPAAVDAESGYRYYGPDQLGPARLIADLRAIGMPLAEIRTVCDLSPEAAAEAVTAFWRREAAGNAARARNVVLLVERLTKEGSTMSDTAVRFHPAARVDIGAGRDTNEDEAYAGDGLLAVADGMRGAAGAAASRTAIGALRALELGDEPAPELLARLAAAIDDVDRRLRGSGTGDEQPVTTLTALLRRGTQLALVHIGDTRAHLLRGGELSQLTQDHSWVQAEVGHGRLSPAEAAAHPRRALLTRALGAGRQPVEADLALRTAQPGDRYLLCTDGLSAVVDRADLLDVLTTTDDPGRAADRLIELAHAAGAPDNIACVVADLEPVA